MSQFNFSALKICEWTVQLLPLTWGVFVVEPFNVAALDLLLYGCLFTEKEKI